MLNQFSRAELIFGKEAIKKLSKFRVAVFGIGGVGSYAAEALVRGGIGSIDLIDNDEVNITNINRQLFATHKTIGKDKVDVAIERLKEINPKVVVKTYKTFFLPETSPQFDFTQYDYILDAIDTVKGKIELVVRAKESGAPIICSMGAGNKLDPTAFKVADIFKTKVCPLARVMRQELKKRGIKNLKVVYSEEAALKPIEQIEDVRVPASTSFVPPVVGLIMAGEVIKDLIKI